MKRLVLFSVAVGLAATLVATSALGKGASRAKITGPALGKGITLAGEEQVGGGQLMQLAEAAGFFPAVFVTDPNPMLFTRPQGALGPRYANEEIEATLNRHADAIAEANCTVDRIDDSAELCGRTADARIV